MIVFCQFWNRKMCSGFLCAKLVLVFTLRWSVCRGHSEQCNLLANDQTCESDNSIDRSSGEPLTWVSVPPKELTLNHDVKLENAYGVQFEHSSLLDINHLPEFAKETNWTEVWFAFEEAAFGTFNFLRLWLVFLRLVAVPFFKCLGVFLEALLPHLLTLLAYLIACFQRLDPVYQVFSVLAAVFSGVCYRKGYLRKARMMCLETKRRVWLRYRAIIASIARKSRVAAILLPHLAFVLVGYLVVNFFPASVVWMLSHDGLFSMLALWYPFLRSARAIRKNRMLEEMASVKPPAVAARYIASTNQKQQLDQIDYEPYLKYSVLYAIATCGYTMLHSLVPSFVASYIQFSFLWANLCLMWIHLPVTQGDMLLYSILSRYLSPYANRIVDVNDTFRGRAVAQNGNEANEHVNVVLRTLTALGVLPNHVGHLLHDLWHQGPALVALIFLFTPGFVTSRGCVCLGFGFPAYVTMGALAQKKSRLYEWWLLYFCVVVIIEYIYDAFAVAFSWVPLFYHIKLLVMMWLQFPYFRGAQRIFDTVLASVFIKQKRD